MSFEKERRLKWFVCRRKHIERWRYSVSLIWNKYWSDFLFRYCSIEIFCFSSIQFSNVDKRIFFKVKLTFYFIVLKKCSNESNLGFVLLTRKFTRINWTKIREMCDAIPILNTLPCNKEFRVFYYVRQNF
jgi:hypothetical protein